MKTTIKVGALALALLIAIPSSVCAADVDTTLKKSLGSILPKESKVISVGNFTFMDKKLGSEFSAWLREKIAVLIPQICPCQVFDKDNAGQILQTVSTMYADNSPFDKDNLPMPPEFKAINGLVTGTFYDEGKNVSVFINYLPTDSGAAMQKTQITLLKTDIPSAIALLPENYQSAVNSQKEMSQVAATGSTSLAVEAWTDRGSGGVYHNGEDLVINVFANKDCYLKIYHVSVTGQQQVIFPNQYHPSPLIEGKKVIRMGDDHAAFWFYLEPPYGTEFILVYASTTPFVSSGLSEKPQSVSGADMAKALKTQAPKDGTKQETVKVQLSYTIVK
jgi:hypothetical protein